MLQLIFWILTGLIFGLGLLFGATRGLNRSLLRFVLIILCVVGAYFLRNVIADKILAVNIQGNTIEEIIQNALIDVMQLTEQQAEDVMHTIIMPMAKSLICVMCFVLVFLALRLITWMILYPLLKLLVKKGKKNRSGLGLLIGALQGAVIALCICIPLAGIIGNVGRVAGAAVDLAESAQQSSAMVSVQDTMVLYDSEPADEGETDKKDDKKGSDSAIMDKLGEFGEQFITFGEKGIGKFYVKTCEKPFNWIATVKVEKTYVNENNEEVTETEKFKLSDGVEAFESMAKTAKTLLQSIEKLRSVDFTNLDSVTELKAVFKELDDSMPQSEAAKEMLNTIVEIAIDKLPGDNEFVNEFKNVVSGTNFTDIKFANEIEIVESLNKTLEKGEEMDASDLSQVISDLSGSTIMLPIMENINADLDVDSDTKAHMEQVFDELDLKTDAERETAEILKHLLGIN